MEVKIIGRGERRKKATRADGVKMVDGIHNASLSFFLYFFFFFFSVLSKRSHDIYTFDGQFSLKKKKGVLSRLCTFRFLLGFGGYFSLLSRR